MAAQCLGQQIKVGEGSDPDRESAWVTLTVRAQNSFPLANGKGPFAPTLTVRCDAKGKGGKDTSVGVFLDTGGLKPGNLSAMGASSEVSPEAVTRLARESVLLQMSVDGGRPQKRRWQLLPKSDAIYQYWGEGETAVGSILSPGQFLEKMFGARLLTIDFQPFGRTDIFAAQFDTAGLKSEFKKHKACSLD